MSKRELQFEDRVTALAAKGSVRKRKGTQIIYAKRPDGLLVPVTAADISSRFPWKLLCFVVAAALGLKTGLFVVLGEEAVMMRAAELAQSRPAANAAVMLLQPEPVSEWLVVQTQDFISFLR